MTRHCTRRHIPRPPHTNRTKRPTIRNNFIYCLRSVFLCWLLLGILSLQPSTNTRIRRMLTTNRNLTAQPTWSSTTKYYSPTGIRSINYLSSPQLNRRGSKPYNSRPIYYNYFRPIFYHSSSLWIPGNTFHNLRQCIRINILHSHRIPWTSRNHWFYLSRRMSPSTIKLSLYIQPPFRIWSSRLILTFRRCSLTFPLRIYLLMRLILS